MKKLVSLGLLALSLGIFSSSLLAGNVEDCESLKQSGQKSLYGLCVAWHNADESAKDGLAQKFLNRAGYPVPGSEDPEPDSDFDCPCWSSVTYEDICALGIPSTNIVGPNSADVGFFDSINFVVENFGSNTELLACAHVIVDLQAGNILLNTILVGPEDGMDANAALDCFTEATLIGSLWATEICQ